MKDKGLKTHTLYPGNTDGLVFDLQRFSPDGDGEPGAGDGAGTSGAGDTSVFQFSGDFVEKVDPVTKKPIKIPKELDPILGHFISTTRQSVENQFKPLMAEIESENTELKTVKEELDKLKEASMTAEERAQKNAEKVIREHEKIAKVKTEESEMWKTRFESTTIRNDILSSFGDSKLFNPGQVALLFQDEGRASISEIVDETGKPIGVFETRVLLTLEDDKGEPEHVEGTPGELFKKWISLDRNLHHVQNEMAPGNGAPQSRAKGSRVDQDADPVTRMQQLREAQGRA